MPAPRSVRMHQQVLVSEVFPSNNTQGCQSYDSPMIQLHTSAMWQSHDWQSHDTTVHMSLRLTFWLAATCALTSLGCRHEDIGFHCCQDTCLEMWAAQWDLWECVCVRVCLGGRGGLNSICPVVIHLSIHPSIHLSIYPRLSLFPYLLLERCHSGQLKRLHTHSLL